MSRYSLIRRRLAPLAFVVGMGLIVHQTCTAEQRTHATIELDLGELAATATAVDAEVVVGAESIAKFHRAALPGMHLKAPRFEVAMPAPDGNVHVDVELPTTHATVVRAIHADEGAVIRVRAY